MAKFNSWFVNHPKTNDKKAVNKRLLQNLRMDLGIFDTIPIGTQLYSFGINFVRNEF